MDFISEKVLEQVSNTDEDTTIILDFANILKVSAKQQRTRRLLFTCFIVLQVDYSACTTLSNLLEICEKKDRPITFQNVKTHVYTMLKHVIKKEHLYLCNETDNVCEDLPSRKWDQIMLPLVKTEKDERERDDQQTWNKNNKFVVFFILKRLVLFYDYKTNISSSRISGKCADVTVNTSPTVIFSARVKIKCARWSERGDKP